MALTRACGAMCSFCYAMVQEPQERANIKTIEALNLLDDFAEIGVKAVSLVSDGESTLSKSYVPFISMHLKLVLILEMQQMVGSLNRKKLIKFYLL